MQGEKRWARTGAAPARPGPVCMERVGEPPEWGIAGQLSTHRTHRSLYGPRSLQPPAEGAVDRKAGVTGIGRRTDIGKMVLLCSTPLRQWQPRPTFIDGVCSVNV